MSGMAADDVGDRGVGESADDIEFRCVGGGQFCRRQRSLPSGRIAPERDRSVRVQRGVRQFHRRPGRVEHRRSGRLPVQPLRRLRAVDAHSDAVGDHDRKAAGQQRRDPALLDVQRQVETLRKVDALVEQPRRCALLARPVGSGRVGQQRARPIAGPRDVGLDIGACHRDGLALSIGAAVHDPGSGPDEGTQLTRGLQRQTRRLGADQVTGLTRRQRIRRGIELFVLPVIGTGVRHTRRRPTRKTTVNNTSDNIRAAASLPRRRLTAPTTASTASRCHRRSG